MLEGKELGKESPLKLKNVDKKLTREERMINIWDKIYELLTIIEYLCSAANWIFIMNST